MCVIKYIKQFYHWMASCVYSPYAESILGFLFFLEAIFFLPTDPMLIMYCINRQEKAFRYATIATIFSVLGGITSYFIGLMLWDIAGEQIIHNKIINYVLSPATFAHLAKQYHQYEWWAILVAGFTPIPYKAATLAAGFCKLSLLPFIVCSFIARGARFYLLAGIIRVLGVHIQQSINRYFNIMIGLTALAFIFSFWIFSS